jgi:hypothetical protein
VLEGLNVLARDRGDGTVAEQRLDVTADAGAIRAERESCFGAAPFGQQLAGLDGSEIEVAQLGDGRGLACVLPADCRIGLDASSGGPGDQAQQPQRLGSCEFGVPGRAIATDLVLALATFRGPILERVSDHVALLAARAETGNDAVPDR